MNVHSLSNSTLILGSAGCQPAVRGSLPRTYSDSTGRLGTCIRQAAECYGWQPVLPKKKPAPYSMLDVER